jgi:dihydrofolate reductase
LYITQVHTTIDGGDTWFPDWDRSNWDLLSSEDYEADEKNQYDYSFMLFERIKNG